MRKLYFYMMKFLLYSILFLSINCSAQSTGQATQKQSINDLKKQCSATSLKDFDTCLRLANEGMERSMKEKDSVSYAFFERYSGLAHYFKGDYSTAAISYFKSIKVLEHNSPNSTELGLSYNELAKLYRKTRKLDLAEETYTKALKLFIALKDSANISTIYNESGVVSEYKEDYEEALRRYGLSLDIAGKLNDKVAVSYALNNIAGVYSIQHKFNLAEAYLLKALSIRKVLKDSFALALNYSDLGANHISEGHYATGLKFLDSSNYIAEKIRYLELQSQNYFTASKANESAGNTLQAYLDYKKYIALKDSIFTTESEKQLNELNTRYQTEKKDLELAKNKAELEAREKQVFIKNTIIGAVITLSVLLFIVGLLFFRKKQVEQKALLDAELAEQKELRTKAILEAEEKERRRIAQDLHDGVGQLLSAAKLNLSHLESKLQDQTPEQENAMQNALNLLDDSVKEVRSVSHNMMPNTLIKLGLASAIKEFITKLGNAPTLKVDLEIVGLDNRLDNQVETVLYRVVQEIVNNIIKHAGASQISMQLVRHETELNILIEDNGAGFDTSRIDDFEGIGLKGIKTRVELLNGTVHFDSTIGRGTTVIIDVPIS